MFQSISTKDLKSSSSDSEGPSEPLREAAGAAPGQLLYCPFCGPRVAASSFSENHLFQWAVNLRCGQCNSSWSICSECSFVRRHYVSTMMLKRHQKDHHKLSIAKKFRADHEEVLFDDLFDEDDVEFRCSSTGCAIGSKPSVTPMIGKLQVICDLVLLVWITQNVHHPLMIFCFFRQ